MEMCGLVGGLSFPEVECQNTRISIEDVANIMYPREKESSGSIFSGYLSRVSSVRLVRKLFFLSCKRVIEIMKCTWAAGP